MTTEYAQILIFTRAYYCILSAYLLFNYIQVHISHTFSSLSVFSSTTMSNLRQNQFSSAKKRNIRDYIHEDDRDSVIPSSPRRIDDDDTDPYSGSKRNVQSSKSPKSPVSSSRSPSSPYSSSPHFPNATSPIYSFPASSGSVTINRAAKIPPRCLAPRDRSIAKYPPPFHPDATPNSRINFHVAVKKASASHHSKVYWVVM